MSPQSPFSTNRPYYLIATIGLIVIICYGIFVALPYLLGPGLTVMTPLQGSTVTSPTVSVSGKTTRVSYLSINDLAVPLSEDGTFTVERAYPKGYTVLVVRARDRFGREVTETIRFIHK